MNRYHLSPFGIAAQPWINEPDTKFNADGVYKVSLSHRLEDPEVQAQKELIDAAAQAAFTRFLESDEAQSFEPSYLKNWSVYLPYQIEEDLEGNPTGNIVFDYRQNAKIAIIEEKALKSPLRVQEDEEDTSIPGYTEYMQSVKTKEIKLRIKDARDRDMHDAILGGSEMRAMYTLRDLGLVSTMQVGVRMEFAQVQVTMLADQQAGAAVEAAEAYAVG